MIYIKLNHLVGISLNLASSYPSCLPFSQPITKKLNFILVYCKETY